MAEILAEEFDDLDDLARASRERLISIPTVGPKIADSIITFFKQAENRNIINRLKKARVWPTRGTAKPVDLPLTGMEFVITGRLEAFSRQEAEVRIKALGGATKDSITLRTTYLVAGADPGSKLTRAGALGTQLLTEEEFLQLIGQIS